MRISVREESLQGIESVVVEILVERIVKGSRDEFRNVNGIALELKKRRGILLEHVLVVRKGFLR